MYADVAYSAIDKRAQKKAEVIKRRVATVTKQASHSQDRGQNQATEGQTL